MPANNQCCGGNCHSATPYQIELRRVNLRLRLADTETLRKINAVLDDMREPETIHAVI